MKNFSLMILLLFTLFVSAQNNFLKTKFTAIGMKSASVDGVFVISGFIEFYQKQIVFFKEDIKEIQKIDRFEYNTNTLILKNGGKVYFKQEDNYMKIFYEIEDVISSFYLEKDDFLVFLDFYNNLYQEKNYYSEGKRLLQDLKYTEALANLDVAIKLNSYSGFAYFLRGSAKAGLNRFASAIEDLNKSIDIEKEAAIYFIVRANCYYNLNEFDLAMKDANTAISIDPSNYLAYKVRGLANFNFKNFRNAIDDLSFVINYYNNDPTIEKDGNVFLMRALSYDIVNDKKKICEDLMKAKNLGLQKATELFNSNCK